MAAHLSGARGAVLFDEPVLGLVLVLVVVVVVVVPVAVVVAGLRLRRGI
jgi:hypothetical protein